MEIVKERPPNYERILEVFPHARGMEVFFAYAPYIYAPRGGELPKVLHNHEALHIERQGDDPAGWWDKYLTDIQFRRNEELVAHVMEYHDRAAMEGGGRSARRRALAETARRLSHRLYGPMFSKAGATRALKHAIQKD